MTTFFKRVQKQENAREYGRKPTCSQRKRARDSITLRRVGTIYS
jgi:hypothetical protein